MMGDLYASALGTTVLQLKEIPHAPSSDALGSLDYNDRPYDDRGWYVSLTHHACAEPEAHEGQAILTILKLGIL